MSDYRLEEALGKYSAIPSIRLREAKDRGDPESLHGHWIASSQSLLAKTVRWERGMVTLKISCAPLLQRTPQQHTVRPIESR